MRQKLIVIGAGMATGRMLEALVEAEADYDITLINGEPRGNYNRIMLSPVLSGEKAYAEIVTHDDEWYKLYKIKTRFGCFVQNIDREKRTVTTDAGEVLPYDKLVFGTGSNPFVIP
ncbi:MAG: nitrite reductase (NADH) large subunit, partial [Yoonia sp.]